MYCVMSLECIEYFATIMGNLCNCHLIFFNFVISPSFREFFDINNFWHFFIRGSMVVVGAVGSHLSQLARLALHVADLRPFPIDSSRHTAFFDSLRTAVRVAGTEGHPVSVVLSSR